LPRRFQPCQHGLRRQQLDPRRRQLDRQRQPVQPRAQLGHRRRAGVGDREVRAGRPGALDEQRHRLVLRQRLEVRQALGVRQLQRRDRELVLAGEVERRATGHQQLHGRAVRQQLGRQRRGGQDLLEVVQYQQH
jgi:hypothetical protein